MCLKMPVRMSATFALAAEFIEWAYQYGVSGNTALSVGILKMPFVSHIDNPYAPNVDLTFGQPRLA